MAIVRYADPADPPTSDADWTSINNQMELMFLAINLPFRVDYAASLVKKGATFFISGTKYLCDADTSITGTASPYVKLLPSGDGSTVSASYVASLTGVTWNTTYNGYYDSGTPASQYYFDEHLATAAGVITTPRLERNTNFYNHDRVALGRGASTAGADAVAIGDGATAAGVRSLSIGDSATSAGSQGVAIGSGTIASALDAVAVGGASMATASGAIAQGQGARATEGGASAYGKSCLASGVNSIAFGTGASASGTGSIAIGPGASANTNNEIAIGRLIYVEFASTATYNTVYDKLRSFTSTPVLGRAYTCMGHVGTTPISSFNYNSSDTNYIDIGGISVQDGASTQIGSIIRLFMVREN